MLHGPGEPGVQADDDDFFDDDLYEVLGRD